MAIWKWMARPTDCLSSCIFDVPTEQKEKRELFNLLFTPNLKYLKRNHQTNGFLVEHLKSCYFEKAASIMLLPALLKLWGIYNLAGISPYEMFSPSTCSYMCSAAPHLELQKWKKVRLDLESWKIFSALLAKSVSYPKWDIYRCNSIAQFKILLKGKIRSYGAVWWSDWENV